MVSLDEIRRAYMEMGTGGTECSSPKTNVSLKEELVKDFRYLMETHALDEMVLYSKDVIVQAFEDMIIDVSEESQTVLFNTAFEPEDLRQVAEDICLYFCEAYCRDASFSLHPNLYKYLVNSVSGFVYYHTRFDSDGIKNTSAFYTMKMFVTPENSTGILTKFYESQAELEELLKEGYMMTATWQGEVVKLPTGFLTSSLSVDREEEYTVSREVLLSKLIVRFFNTWPEDWGQTLIEVYEKQDIDVKRILCLHFIENCGLNSMPDIFGLNDRLLFDIVLRRFAKEVYFEYNPDVKPDSPAELVLAGLPEDARKEGETYLRIVNIITMDRLLDLMFDLSACYVNVAIPLPLIECFKNFKRQRRKKKSLVKILTDSFI